MPEIANAPNWLWMDSLTVAKQGYDAVMKGRSLIINGGLNKFFAILTKVIPEKLTRLIAQGLTKRMY
jgi:short-subunit dehydrogenase